MTTKDYVKFAAAINAASEAVQKGHDRWSSTHHEDRGSAPDAFDGIDAVVEAIVDVLEADNPNFDSSRFYEALTS